MLPSTDNDNDIELADPSASNVDTNIPVPPVVAPRNKHNRTVQTANATFQGMEFIFSDSTNALVFTKSCQLLLSGQAFFKPLKAYERGINCLQTVLTLSQLILYVTMFMGDKTCPGTDAQLCKIQTILGVFYTAIVAGAWGESLYSAATPRTATTQPPAIAAGLAPDAASSPANAV